MAEYHLPEFDAVINRFAVRLNETAAALHDFQAAFNSTDSPEAIIDDYEARQLWRKMPENAVIH